MEVDDGEGEDEGMIEVDVHEGEPRLAKPGALKAEANTIAHLLTHRYKKSVLSVMHSCKDETLQNVQRCVQTEAEEVG